MNPLFPLTTNPLVLLSSLVLLVLIAVAFFHLNARPSLSTTRNKNKVQTVLLVGPQASGKTAILSKVLYGHVIPSHTSIKENEASISRNWSRAGSKEKVEGDGEDADKAENDEHLLLKRPLHLVDIPGHPRLRTRALAQFLPAATGVVFTIDSVTGLTGKNVRDAADHLHILLSLITLHSNQTSTSPLPLLILLTKTDLTPTKTSSQTLSRAKQSLSRELERHRLSSLASTTTAGARLEGLEPVTAGAGEARGVKGVLKAFGANGNGERGGLPEDEAEVLSADAFQVEGPFEWEKVEGSVKWAVGSVEGGEGGVDYLWQWIEDL
ncbi:signal recognition particle receptor subunit beta, partial [Phenoliferia sp. Uapishka_3]